MRVAGGWTLALLLGLPASVHADPEDRKPVVAPPEAASVPQPPLLPASAGEGLAPVAVPAFRPDLALHVEPAEWGGERPAVTSGEESGSDFLAPSKTGVLLYVAIFLVGLGLNAWLFRPRAPLLRPGARPAPAARPGVTPRAPSARPPSTPRV